MDEPTPDVMCLLPPDLRARVTLTIGETLATTGLGRTSTYVEIRSGRLKTIVVGRRRLVPVVSLAQWLAARVEEG